MGFARFFVNTTRTIYYIQDTMKNWIIKQLLKMLSYDTLVEIIAKALAYIMEYARKHSSEEGWEKAKSAIKQVKNWITLLDEVYEDDTLTPDEEKRIQDAIAGCTATESIYELVTGNKTKPTKKTTKKTTKRGKRK